MAAYHCGHVSMLSTFVMLLYFVVLENELSTERSFAELRWVLLKLL